VRGSTAAIEVEITRGGGFAGEVVIDVEGLPTGVGADAITIAAGDTTGTLAVQALSSADLGGPTRITVAATGGADLASSLELPAYVAGEPGELDTSFSFDGELLHTATDSEYDAVSGAAFDDQGRLLIGGEGQGEIPPTAWMVRFLPDGSLDGEFGDRGELLEFDGPVVSVGSIHAGSSGSFHAVLRLQSGETSSSVLRKFAGDGTADSGYGTGGDVELPAGARVLGRGTGHLLISSSYFLALDQDGDQDAEFSAPELDKIPWSAAVDGEGRVVLGMAAVDPPFTLLRLTREGDLDPAFGDAGSATWPVPEENNDVYVHDVALGSDGGGAAVASSRFGGIYENQVVVLRFDAEGNRVNGFADDGAQVVEESGMGSRVLLQPDGRVLVSGYRTDGDSVIDRRLERYDPDGQLDNTFGSDGERILPVGLELKFLLHDAASGRAIVVGDQPGGGIYAVRVWL
jgi:uncharacterized delta-60 repeat protein